MNIVTTVDDDDTARKAADEQPRPYTGTYLGGRERQQKERNKGKQWKAQAKRKAQSGMFF